MRDSAFHVSVPFSLLQNYLPLIRKDRLNLEISFNTGNFDTIQRRDIIELRDTLDYDPKLTFHAPFMDLSPAAVDPGIRKVTLQRFSSVLDFAEILKPIVIVFHSGYDSMRYDGHEETWLSGSLKTWVPLAERAGEIGAQIAIENVFEDNPRTLRRLVYEVGTESFGLCFDTGHFNLYSRVPLSEWLESVGPYIKEMHLHDNHGDGDDHLPPGDGTFDFDTVFETETAPGCVYTIEVHTVDRVQKSLENLRDYIAK